MTTHHGMTPTCVAQAYRPAVRQAALKGCATALALAIAAACVVSGFSRTLHAQDGKTVADGVFTEAQATRGATAYESACAGCHRADLRGNTGPALRDQRFARTFAGKDLKTLFTRIATTMPRNAPASLGDNVSLDIVAHVLKENGFPAGPKELTADGLDGVRVLAGRPKPPPPIGDFSYVEVVGCLTAEPAAPVHGGGKAEPASPKRDSAKAWILTRASVPVVPTSNASATRPTATAPATPLGTETFHLLDAMAYAPQDHVGHKMYVRGLLIRLPGEQRMTISALEMVSPTCSE